LAGEFPAFKLGNNYRICTGSAHGLGVALLTRARDDFQLGIEGLGGDGDVEVVGVIVDDHAKSAGAGDSGFLKDAVALCVAMENQSAFLEQLAIEAFIRFD